jgi:acetate kinase
VSARPDAAVLCLNSGSSSVKVALLLPDGAGSRAAPGERSGAPRAADVTVESIGSEHGRARARGTAGPGAIEQSVGRVDHQAAIEIALDLVSRVADRTPEVVAHRVVHGGLRYTAPARVDDALVRSLEEMVPLAPLHLPASVAGIRATLRRWPDLPQVACFDTAFHATLPEVARRLPLPDSVLGEEVRRYGFHGLSYAHVMWVLGPTPPPRIVIAHLGSGSSLVAVKDGRAIDTTMGFTPTGGIPMGTRTGDLDPGVLFYLARNRRLSIDELERICDREGGLQAIGGTSDMRELLARAPRDPDAAAAIATYVYAIRKAVGAFAAALGGLDLLVFTGGIGEHAPAVRLEACRELGHLGVEIDLDQNRLGVRTISRPGSACEVLVIPADEESAMARDARASARA